MSERDVTIADIVDTLTAPAGDTETRIPSAPAKVLAAYLYDTLDIQSGDQARMQGSSILTSAMQEVDKKIPKTVLAVVKKWAQISAGERDDSPTVAAPPTPSLSVPSKVAKKKKDEVLADDGDDSDGGCSVVGASIKESKQKQAERDARNTGMSKTQNQAFAASLYVGYAVSADEVEGLSYGTDISLTEFARRIKKTDISTFPDKLKKGDIDDIDEHLVGLMRSFNEENQTAEMTLLTSVMTTTNELFGDDHKGKIKYYKSLLAKYKGRGFPMPEHFDVALVVKGLKISSSGSSAASAVTKLQAEVGELKGKIGELKSAANEAKQAHAQLKTKFDALASKKSGSPDDDNKPACGYCHKKGHFARDCPKKKADEAAAREAEAEKDE